jgi:hypothetical protein
MTLLDVSFPASVWKIQLCLEYVREPSRKAADQYGFPFSFHHQGIYHEGGKEDESAFDREVHSRKCFPKGELVDALYAQDLPDIGGLTGKDGHEERGDKEERNEPRYALNIPAMERVRRDVV